MSEVLIEQATLQLDPGQTPRLTGRSPGLTEAHVDALHRLLIGYGEAPAGWGFQAIFAKPVEPGAAAVVQTKFVDGRVAFHVLIVSRRDYEGLGGDPFALADRFPFSSETNELPTLRLPAQPLDTRGVEQVRAVLRRIKANALPEGGDPAKLPEPTEANAESPTLLGGVQILIDGCKLAFERASPDPSLLKALWTLLPQTTRSKLWPTTFAFDNSLGFDVLVAPKLANIELRGYSTEDQAGDYPAGSYELALQSAAESGDETALRNLFHRRTNNEAMGLALKLLVGITLLMIGFRIFAPPPTIDRVPRAAAVAAIVGVGDPWSACMIIDDGQRRFLK